MNLILPVERRTCGFLLSTVAITMLLHGMIASAQAETLKQALASAYLHNPVLKAERVRRRSVDEELSIAGSGYRPRISLDVDSSIQEINTRPSQLSDGITRPKGFTIAATQPVFRGFRTVNAVREADAKIDVAREQLRLVEQNTLLEAAQAYFNVATNFAILDLRRKNINVLRRQLATTKALLAAKESKAYDVALSNSRLSRAISQLKKEKVGLKTSQADYRRLIGHRSGTLRLPKMLIGNHMLRKLPASLKEAKQIARSLHPQILVTRYQERQAGYSADKIRGEMLPEVNLDATYDHRFDTSKFIDEQQTTTLKLRVRIPLYQGGEVRARMRQAREIRLQRSLEINSARVQIDTEVESGWENFILIKEQIEANREQVEFSQLALREVRAEKKAGSLTVLQVLDAEEELLTAEITLLTSKKDKAAAVFKLLSAIGRLDLGEFDVGIRKSKNLNEYDRRSSRFGLVQYNGLD